MLTLKGFTQVTVEVGDKFSETGYSAVDCYGKDLTASVKVNDTANYSRAGIYLIHYEVSDAGGNMAKASRTVVVEEPPRNAPPPTAPKITVNGSNPIILHVGGTAYTEQGALAIDAADGDISNKVKISGSVNTSKAGTYTLTYSISNAAGITSTATRNVRVIAPTESISRQPYGFSAQSKEGASVTHKGIESVMPGYMDLKVSSIDKNMTITVSLVNTANGKAMLTDTFSAAGSKQYYVDEGKYDLVVKVDKANGNSKYTIDLLMPEVVWVTFSEEEVPYGDLPASGSNDGGDGYLLYSIIGIGVLLVGICVLAVIHTKKRRNADVTGK